MVRRTKAEAEKTKNALLTSAVVLFSERGVSKATLEDIATAAGVTKGAFYWHFKNKTEVLFAIRDRYLTLLERELFIQNLKKTNNISSILSVWSDFFKIFEHSDDILRFKKIIVKCDDVKLLSKLLLDEYKQLEIIRRVVADSIASIPESEWQEAKIGDCKFIAKMAVNYVDGYIYRQVITNHKVSSQEIIDSIKVIFRGGGIILP